MAIIDINNGEPKYLTPFSYNVIGFPYIQNDTVYFSYSYQKNDELFAYTFADEKLWRIECGGEEGIGKYQPSANTPYSLECFYRRRISFKGSMQKQMFNLRK